VELDAASFTVAIPAVLFAAVSKGRFGAGAGFVASPLLALVLEPAAAVALMLPLLMLMDLTGLRPYWGRWSWIHCRRLMVGALPGVAIGALLFGLVSADGVRLLVGGIALGFVAFQLARNRGWLQPALIHSSRAGWGFFWGTVTGFTSFVSHAGGPPAAMYPLGARLDKTRYQASTVLVFWWVNLIKFPLYLALGLFTAESAKANLILAPIAIAGVLLGVRGHNVIPEKLFFRLTYALLLVTGSKLLIDAL
jgi:uncharacterized membrane protein YfcA